MKKTLLVMIGLMIFNPIHVFAKPSIISLYATSKSQDSGSLTCLLESGCNGSWTPRATDSGTDEGIYFQLDKPVNVDYIVLTFQNEIEKGVGLVTYINGKTTSPKTLVYQDFIFNKNSLLVGARLDYTSLQPMGVPLQSFFIKLDSHWSSVKKTPVLVSIRLYEYKENLNPEKIDMFNLPQPIDLMTPKLIPAKITATSILNPVTAYQPGNLFDSKIDSGWATDGQKSNGVGESVKIEFDKENTISGLIVWNGYQRSSTHYDANSRVKKIDVVADGNKIQTVDLKDKNGRQAVKFDQPLTTRHIEIKISDIFPGVKYKDALISELRFLDQDSRIIIPTVQLSNPQIPPPLSGIMDRSWASYIHGASNYPEECGGPCFNKRIRMRSDGTFVIYDNFDYGNNNNGEVLAKVLEGNWEDKNGAYRIFGKKYQSAIRTSEYLQESKTILPEIFQSQITFTRYNDLSADQKNKIVGYLWKTRLMKSTGTPPKDMKWYWAVNDRAGSEYTGRILEGTTPQELQGKLSSELRKLNPVYIHSSVFEDLVLPTDEVHECASGC